MPKHLRLIYLAYAFSLLLIAFLLGAKFDYRGFYLWHWGLAWKGNPYIPINPENVYPPAFFFLALFWKLHPLLPKVFFVGCGLLLQWIALERFFPRFSEFPRSFSYPWIGLLVFPVFFLLFTVAYGCADAWLALLIFAAVTAKEKGRNFWSGVLLSFAGFTKIYPFFLVPIFLKPKAARLPFLVGLFIGSYAIMTIAFKLWGTAWLTFFQFSLAYEAELASFPAFVEQTFQIRGDWQYFYHAFFLFHYFVAAYVIWKKQIEIHLSIFLLLSTVFASFTMGHLQFLVVPMFFLFLAIPKLSVNYVFHRRFSIFGYLLWISIIGILLILQYHHWQFLAEIRFRDLLGFFQYFVVITIVLRLTLLRKGPQQEHYQ